MGSGEGLHACCLRGWEGPTLGARGAGREGRESQPGRAVGCRCRSRAGPGLDGGDPAPARLGLPSHLAACTPCLGTASRPLAPPPPPLPTTATTSHARAASPHTHPAPPPHRPTPTPRFELLARLCPNSTGADIRSVATEAGMYAIRARRKTVTEKDFLDAVNKARGL